MDTESTKMCVADYQCTAENISTRLWKHIDKSGPASFVRGFWSQCWDWTGELSDKGYGRLCAITVVVSIAVYLWIEPY